MYIFRNALRNILRSPGRSLLVGIIILIITFSSCIGLSIKQAAKTVQESGLEGITVSATISIDRQAMMQNAQRQPGGFMQLLGRTQGLSLSEMEKYARSRYVKEVYYTISTSVAKGDGLEPVDTVGDQTYYGISSQLGRLGQNLIGRLDDRSMGGNFRQGDFTLTGFSDQGAMQGFMDGTSKVSDGAVFDFKAADDTCIISDQLALVNEIGVGDRITVKNPSLDTEAYELTIIGLYSVLDTSEANSALRFSNASDPANQIYVSYPTLLAISERSESVAQIGVDGYGNAVTTALRTATSGRYIFNNIEDYEAFQEDARTMGLSSDYVIVSSDVENYKRSLVPLENLSRFATTFLAIILSIGAVILVVINIFNIRERKYEVGVLTAIGMKKGKVASQFILEIIIITAFAMVLGTASAAVASLPTVNHLLANQVELQQQQSINTQQAFGGMRMDGAEWGGQRGGLLQGGLMQGSLLNIQYLSSVEDTMNPEVLLQVAAIGIALALVSSSAAVVYILRYEPLRILSERS